MHGGDVWLESLARVTLWVWFDLLHYNVRLGLSLRIVSNLLTMLDWLGTVFNLVLWVKDHNCHTWS